jgi:hypothetical protein
MTELEDKLIAVVEAGLRMRKAQVEYFKSRDRQALIEARQLETQWHAQALGVLVEAAALRVVS